jgi:tRNA(Ile)-lysidine synthase
MIKLVHKLPRELIVAVSGGVDSMAAWHFLSKNHRVAMAFFHHNTDNSERASQFLAQYCKQHNIVMYMGHCVDSRQRHQSQEEFWREQRYNFLEKLDGTVVTAHHLDDCVETYVWSTMHGCAKVIPYQRNNVVRPFLLTKKNQLQQWCVRHQVPWCEDTSNQDQKYMRNYIRHQVLPHVKHINPGIDRVVGRVVQKQLVEELVGFTTKPVDSNP